MLIVEHDSLVGMGLLKTSNTKALVANEGNSSGKNSNKKQKQWKAKLQDDTQQSSSKQQSSSNQSSSTQQSSSNKGSILPTIIKRGKISTRRRRKLVPIVRGMVMMNMSARISSLMNWST
jgi:hypothetical protein